MTSLRNKVYLSPKPLRTLKDLVTGNVSYNQSEVLMHLEHSKFITQVSNHFEIDIFLVGLDNKSVFKIDSSFIYAIQEPEEFSFIMLPEEGSLVKELSNFIKNKGVCAVIKSPRSKGKKRHTTDSIKYNLEKVVNFSGYVKHILQDSIYNLAIVNNLPFMKDVLFRGDYSILEIPKKAVKLSSHLANYNSCRGKKLAPVSEDKHGYFEYKDADFKFIIRLVLQHHFDPQRIAEAFRLPSEAFIGYLVKQYRYKVGNIESMSYDNAKHDIKPFYDYNKDSLSYDSNRFYRKEIA